MSTTNAVSILANGKVDDLSDDALEAAICGFAARLAAASCRWVLAIAEYDRREAWRSWGCKSMVHWLTWKCAMSPAAAREHVRIGIALAELGLVHAQFADGRLSYSQVRALTRVVTPATEADWVRLARVMTGAQLESVARGYRRATANAVDAGAAVHARRGLTWRTEEDGSLVATIRLSAEDGAVLMKAVDAAMDARRADGLDDAADGRIPPVDPTGAARADALVDIAAHYLRNAVAREDADIDGEPGDDRYLVTVVAEARVLEAPGRVDGVCETEAGVGLDPCVVRGLACDSPTVTIVEDQLGRVLDVGRRTRRPNRAMRRALARRDGGCVFPGCGARRTQAHHFVHWIDGGTTTLENLVSLCAFHHRGLHLGAFTIEARPGGWRFIRGDGRLIPAASPLDAADQPEPGVEPAADTVTPDWDGGRLQDLSGIVDGLLRQAGLITEPLPPPPQPDIPSTVGVDTDPPREHLASTRDSRWPDPWRDPWDPAPWPGE